MIPQTKRHLSAARTAPGRPTLHSIFENPSRSLIRRGSSRLACVCCVMMPASWRRRRSSPPPPTPAWPRHCCARQVLRTSISRQPSVPRCPGGRWRTRRGRRSSQRNRAAAHPPRAWSSPRRPAPLPEDDGHGHRDGPRPESVEPMERALDHANDLERQPARLADRRDHRERTRDETDAGVDARWQPELRSRRTHRRCTQFRRSMLPRPREPWPPPGDEARVEEACSDPNAAPPRRRRRSSPAAGRVSSKPQPFYWAAFQLFGDWQ